MEAILCWVVALRAEATPLILRERLRALGTGGGLFPVYSSADGAVRLIISGVGKVNAAAATAYLAASLPSESIVGWINFGIAGSGEVPFGTVVLTGSILDEATGRRWFPGTPLYPKGSLTRKGVMTVDRPREEYPAGGGLIEMEAAGFYPTALRRSTTEFCQVVKVVSDGPGNPVSAINQSVVGDLCENAVREMDSWLRGFRELLQSESVLTADPPGYVEWISGSHFSVTQGFQLRRLLQEWGALGIVGYPDPEDLAGDGRRRGGREALRLIRERLSIFRQELFQADE